MNSNVSKPSVSTLMLRRLLNAPSQSDGRKLGVTQVFESTHREWRVSDMLFAVATAGVADVARFQDVSNIADTPVMVKVRMVNKAAGTIVRDVFMLCSKRRFGQYCLDEGVSANSCRRR